MVPKWADSKISLEAKIIQYFQDKVLEARESGDRGLEVWLVTLFIDLTRVCDFKMRSAVRQVTGSVPENKGVK